MLLAILILICVPLFFNNFLLTHFVAISGMFRPFFQYLIQGFFVSCIILGWIGGNPAVYPYIEIGFIHMLIYFFCLTYGLFACLIFEYNKYNQSSKIGCSSEQSSDGNALKEDFLNLKSRERDYIPKLEEERITLRKESLRVYTLPLDKEEEVLSMWRRLRLRLQKGKPENNKFTRYKLFSKC